MENGEEAGDKLFRCSQRAVRASDVDSGDFEVLERQHDALCLVHN